MRVLDLVIRSLTPTKESEEHKNQEGCRLGGGALKANKSNLFFVVKCKAVTTDIQACKRGALRLLSSFCVMHVAPRGEIADARWFSKEIALKERAVCEEEFLALPFPEKGTLWDELNHSALDAEASKFEAYA